MNHTETTRPDLEAELVSVRQRVAELEALVTAQQHENELLQGSEARFSGIVNIATEAIISVDDAHKIILFNKGAEDIFGYAAGEVIGQPLDRLLPPRFVAAHHRHINEFAASTTTARLMGERQQIYGCRKNGEEFPAEASIAKSDVGDKKNFTVVLRDITVRKQAEQGREDQISRLKYLNEAAQAISAELSREQVLQKITDTARTLVRANYAALGIHNGKGRIAQFVTAGIDPADQPKIGPLPTGGGLLGHLLRRGESLLVKDIGRHPAAVGFPEHHPEMRNLLGVPIYSKRELIGALYLTDKEDDADFTEIDQQLVETLALHAAIAIENADLYAQTQRLAVLEERERFARDLHDGIIQSIYGVGLILDQIKVDVYPTDEQAAEQIDMGLKSLATVIQDLRNYIFDLRPQALRYQGLAARLEGLIKELRVNTLLPIHTEINPDIDAYLGDMQARHVFHICHEALANAARHAKAKQLWFSLNRDEEQITLSIKDDGVGFKMSPEVKPGHHGLANIRTRAAEIGATLTINSVPQQGTHLSLIFRCSTLPD